MFFILFQTLILWKALKANNLNETEFSHWIQEIRQVYYRQDRCDFKHPWVQDYCLLEDFYHRCFLKKNDQNCEKSYARISSTKNFWRKNQIEKWQVSYSAYLIQSGQWYEAVRLFKEKSRTWSWDHRLEIFKRILPGLTQINDEQFCSFMKHILSVNFTDYEWLMDLNFSKCTEMLENLDFHWQNLARNLAYNEQENIFKRFTQYLEKIHLYRSSLMISFFFYLASEKFDKAQEVLNRLEGFQWDKSELINLWRFKYLMSARLGDLKKAINEVDEVLKLDPPLSIKKEAIQDGINFSMQMFDLSGLDKFLSHQKKMKILNYNWNYQKALLAFILGYTQKTVKYLDEIPQKYYQPEHLFLKTLVYIKTNDWFKVYWALKRLWSFDLWYVQLFFPQPFYLEFKVLPDVNSLLSEPSVVKLQNVPDCNEDWDWDENIIYDQVLMVWPSCLSQKLLKLLAKAHAWSAIYEYLNFLGLSWPEDIREIMKRWVQKIAPSSDIDPDFVLAIMQAESRFDPKALSGVGARGLMQLLPKTARKLAQMAKIHYRSSQDLWQPEFNVKLAIFYLEKMAQEADFECLPLWIAGYNAGWHRAQTWWYRWQNAQNWWLFIEWVPFSQTRDYLKKVLKFYRHFGGYFNPFVNFCTYKGVIQLQEEWHTN